MLEEKTTRSFAIGAAAGLTAGLAANAIRKIFVQAPTLAAGEWDDALAAEHAAVLKLFDAIQATEDAHTTRRSILLTQIGHALPSMRYRRRMPFMRCCAPMARRPRRTGSTATMAM